MDICIDFNCDLGEGFPHDEALMPFISSANIACGAHAGDTRTMRQTLALCATHGVAVGAHPGFDDPAHFGRREIMLSTEALYDTVYQQILSLHTLAAEMGLSLHHVKPHGAMYNMAARNPLMSRTIALAVKAVDETLILYGLSGSFLISEAAIVGLRTASEVFADRSYQDDGSLTPRHEANALIKDPEQSITQVMRMVKAQEVASVSGRVIHIEADTICLHGDHTEAVAFAQHIHQFFTRNQIGIQTV